MKIGFWSSLLFAPFFTPVFLDHSLFAKTNAPNEETTRVAPTPSESRMAGMLDLRPSWTSKQGEWHTENLAEIGYQFTPKFITTLDSDFATTLLDPSSNPGSGTPFKIVDGFVRTRYNKFWESGDAKNNLSYECRTYLPVDDLSRRSEMLVTFRNYVKFTHQLNSTYSITLMDLPILPLYGTNGFTSSGSANANPAFENRIYAILTATHDKWYFSFPIMFHATRYRNYLPTAAFNNDWGFWAWIYPEIDYYFTPKLAVGVAFYSDNLIQADLSGLTLGKGMERGVPQLVVTTYL